MPVPVIGHLLVAGAANVASNAIRLADFMDTASNTISSAITLKETVKEAVWPQHGLSSDYGRRKDYNLVSRANPSEYQLLYLPPELRRRPTRYNPYTRNYQRSRIISKRRWRRGRIVRGGSRASAARRRSRFSHW